MPEAFVINNITKALDEKLYPSITIWERLEGRPRTADFERSLRAEARDALFMLTRQWQAAEFQGEDAGAPVRTRVAVRTSRLTRLQLGDSEAQDLSAARPLEQQVQARPTRLVLGADKIALDLRLVLGQRWLELITGIGAYAPAFTARYPFAMPDATARDDAAICADADTWQSFAAVAGRAMDGGALYLYLHADAAHHAYDGVAVATSHRAAIDAAASSFLAFADELLGPRDDAAWQPQRLEYQFAVASRDGLAERVFRADRHHGGALDWYSFDLDASGSSLGALAGPPDDIVTRTMLPKSVRYPGMPEPRWWTFEDGQTNFGAIRPDTTDISKLLLVEFGLIYSNDWYVVPITLNGDSVATAEGVVVTDTFGGRFWIDAAGAEADWQRWSIFSISQSDPGTAAIPSLVFLPTAAKVNDGSALEDVSLIRDEIADMVWGIENTVSASEGRGRPGLTLAREVRSYHERLVNETASSTPAPLLENDAVIRYDVMSSVPENWIPFISVRADGSSREISLQRAAMLRLVDNDPLPPSKIRPRTVLLRTGLDDPQPAPYFVANAEVPRSGTRLSSAYRRARWRDGRVVTWLGIRRESGRGEGSSGLAFDRLLPKER